MTKREEILRKGLERFQEFKFEPIENDIHDQGIATGLYIARVQIGHILREADEIKEETEIEYEPRSIEDIDADIKRINE